MYKTPVSILQEMMVKKSIVPNFELIHDGGGTHINTFTYKVTCDDLTATGTGRCKKDAKHEAAKAMLETIATQRGYLQLPATPAQSPVRTPVPPTIPETPRIPPNVPFVNAVGALQDLCVVNKLQEPIYKQISDVGPPHAKIFTIQCEVSTFKEIGVAKTKKQAKQEAAKKMFDKLTDLVPNFEVPVTLDVELDDSRKMAEARFPELSRSLVTKKVNLGVKLSEYHMHIKNQFDIEIRKETIEKLMSFIPSDGGYVSEAFVENLLTNFKDILMALGLNISQTVFTTKSKSIVGMKIDTSPNIVEMGIGSTKAEAEFHAIQNLVDTLICFLK